MNLVKNNLILLLFKNIYTRVYVCMYKEILFIDRKKKVQTWKIVHYTWT